MVPCDGETQAPFSKSSLSEEDFLLELHNLEEEIKGVGGEYATYAPTAAAAAAAHPPLPFEEGAEPSVSPRGDQWGLPGHNLLGCPGNVEFKAASRAWGPPPLAPQRTGAPLTAIEEEGEKSRRGSVESRGCATPRTSAGTPGHSFHQHQPQHLAPLAALPLPPDIPAPSSSSSLSPSSLSSSDLPPTSPRRRGAGRNGEKGMDDGVARGENPVEQQPPTPSPRRSPIRSPARTPRSPIGSPVRSPRRRGTTSAELHAVCISPSSHFAPAGQGAFATTRKETLDNGPGAPPRTLSKATATIQRGPPRSVPRGGHLPGAGQDAGESRGQAPKLASVIVFDSGAPPSDIAAATSAAGSEPLELDIRALLDVQNEAKEEVVIDALSSQSEIFALGDFHVSDPPCALTPEGEVENDQGPFLEDGLGDGLALYPLPLPAASNGHEKDSPAPQRASANGPGPRSRDNFARPGGTTSDDSTVQDSSDESSRKHPAAGAAECAGNARHARQAFECLDTTFIRSSNGTGPGSPGIVGGGHGGKCSDNPSNIRFHEQQAKAMPPANAGFDSARLRGSPRGTVPRIQHQKHPHLRPLPAAEGERQTINVPLSLKTEATSHAADDPIPAIKLPLEVAVESVRLDPLPSVISLPLDTVQNHESAHTKIGQQQQPHLARSAVPRLIASLPRTGVPTKEEIGVGVAAKDEAIGELQQSFFTTIGQEGTADVHKDGTRPQVPSNDMCLVNIPLEAVNVNPTSSSTIDSAIGNSKMTVNPPPSKNDTPVYSASTSASSITAQCSDATPDTAVAESPKPLVESISLEKDTVVQSISLEKDTVVQSISLEKDTEAVIGIESPSKPLVESLSLQKDRLAMIQAGRTSLYRTGGPRRDIETSGMRRSSCGCFSAWRMIKNSSSKKLEDKQINIFGTHDDSSKGSFKACMLSSSLLSDAAPTPIKLSKLTHDRAMTSPDKIMRSPGGVQVGPDGEVAGGAGLITPRFPCRTGGTSSSALAPSVSSSNSNFLCDSPPRQSRVGPMSKDAGLLPARVFEAHGDSMVSHMCSGGGGGGGGGGGVAEGAEGDANEHFLQVQDEGMHEYESMMQRMPSKKLLVSPNGGFENKGTKAHRSNGGGEARRRRKKDIDLARDYIERLNREVDMEDASFVMSVNLVFSGPADS